MTPARLARLTPYLYILPAAAVEMVLGIALALFLERPVRGMRLFRTVFVLPMMIAPICGGLIWRYLFDANFGPINLWAGALGLSPRAWLAEPELAFLAIIVTDIWQWTPFVLIMVLAALQGIDGSIIEAPSSARSWATRRHCRSCCCASWPCWRWLCC